MKKLKSLNAKQLTKQQMKATKGGWNNYFTYWSCADGERLRMGVYVCHGADPAETGCNGGGETSCVDTGRACMYAECH